ncbi:hypothetical protein IFR05_007798 [Cadophora sp. M221]|nr:hypothetical protein IFR05_007798 [Cadophora sp. M221]
MASQILDPTSTHSLRSVLDVTWTSAYGSVDAVSAQAAFPLPAKSSTDSSTASPTSAKERSDTAATSAANIAADLPSTPSARVLQSTSIIPGPAGIGSLVSVPSTPPASTNNTPSNLAVSSTPSCANTTQANQTLLGLSQPGSSPTISAGQAIVNKAKEGLDEEELASLEKAGVTDDGTNPNSMFDGAYLAAIARQKEYVGEPTVWNIGGSEIKVRDVANNVVKFLNKFKAVGDVAASFDPVHAGLPWAGVKMLLEIPLSNAKLIGLLLSGLEIVLYMGNRLRVYYEYLPKLPAVPARKNFEDALLKLQVMLLKFLAKAIKLYEKNYMSRSWTGFWNAEDITDFDSACNIVASRADTEAGVCSQGIVLDMKAELGELKGIKDSVTRLLNSIELAKLAFAEGSRFDSNAENGEPQCLPRTRVDLLDQIAEWANSSDKESGSFPVVVPKVLEEINRDVHIKDQNLDYLFDHLIKAPLSECIEDPSTVVLVVDALDECDGEGKISNILKLLLRAGEIKPARLRIFLTSRPEDEITKPFQTLSKGRHREIALDDFPQTQQDISTCLTNEFAKISNKPGTDGSDWPGNAVIEELAKLAAPSFIFAATIWRFVADPYETPAEQLKTIRESRFTGQLVENLDRTYVTVLERLNRKGSQVDKRLENQFRKLLETIVVLGDPLSVKALTVLLGEETQDLSQQIVNFRLQRLRSVLQIPDRETSPVRIFHLSFRDFLLDDKKRDENGAKYWFSVDEQEAHSKIARKCLELMCREGSLKMDICKRKEPGVDRSKVSRQVVNEHLSSEVQYACRYWVYHVKKGFQKV